MQLFNLILLWLFFGFLAAFLAKRQKRNPRLWFFIGLAFGLLGVLSLFILPKKQPKQTTPLQPSPQILPPPEVHQLWYYIDALKKPQGPVNFRELKNLWQTSILTERSYLFSDGMEQWKKMEEFPDLVKELNQ